MPVDADPGSIGLRIAVDADPGTAGWPADCMPSGCCPSGTLLRIYAAELKLHFIALMRLLAIDEKNTVEY